MTVRERRLLNWSNLAVEALRYADSGGYGISLIKSGNKVIGEYGLEEKDSKWGDFLAFIFALAAFMTIIIALIFIGAVLE